MNTAEIEKPGRIIKGTAVTKASNKSVKRKSKDTKVGNKPAKVARTDSYSASQIDELKKKMGISTLHESIQGLTSLVQSLASAQSGNKQPANVEKAIPAVGSKKRNVSCTVSNPDSELNIQTDSRQSVSHRNTGNVMTQSQTVFSAEAQGSNVLPRQDHQIIPLDPNLDEDLVCGAPHGGYLGIK